MRRFCAIAIILLPLAVMAAQAGDNYLLHSDLQAQWGALPTKGSPAHDAGTNALLQKDRKGSFVVAHSAADSPGKDVKADNGSGPDLDLRDVDWDSMKAEKKGKTAKIGNGKNVDKVDNGDENGEDEEGEKDDEDKKDEGEGGWDRLWDAPKLG
jgi:hypothetical protein